MSFLGHLEELRWHLLRAFLSIFIIAIAAFIFHDIIFDKIILAPKTPDFFTNRMFCAFSEIVNVPALCINSNPFEIINIRMAGQFTTHIMVSLIAGIILALPVYIFRDMVICQTCIIFKRKRLFPRCGFFQFITVPSWSLIRIFCYYSFICSLSRFI